MRAMWAVHAVALHAVYVNRVPVGLIAPAQVPAGAESTSAALPSVARKNTSWSLAGVLANRNALLGVTAVGY